MKVLSHMVMVVFALLGITVAVINAHKIYQGCPAGEVLVKSVGTYECIRR